MAHPADGKAVNETGDRTVQDAVLGIPGNARTMADRHLDDGAAELPDGDGDEAVHAAILQGQLKGEFPTEDAERAAGIADRVAEEPSSEQAADD